MPRRIYTYLPETRWGTLNFLATIGATIIGTSVLVLITNMLRSYKRGEIAGADPWGAATLEWMTTSPPPRYNFLDLPTVTGGYPAWENTAETPVVTGLDSEKRAVLCTTIMDAVPEHQFTLASDSICPFLLAVIAGMTFTAVIFHPVALILGPMLGAIVMLAWFWQTHQPTDLGFGLTNESGAIK
jgi:cytochrome c oxidase subunit I+III